MPYSASHKEQTREKIVESARILFNRHGFRSVTIDMIMENAGLTRGGFYNHFKTKEALFSAAVSGFLTGRGAQWREEAGVDVTNLNPEMAVHMIDAYLSDKHLGDRDGQCPMIALPSDVARASEDVQQSFQQLLTAMVWLFETNMAADAPDNRREALSIAALCVGGMVLARTLPDSALADEVRAAAHASAVAAFKAHSA
ncbi:TetR family transcriptional regulator [Litoreibacter meonggei]|uniref:TetR family transcriptional regulator n=1 Tax=Litoreibacter meonggei TaxID=1049199 RepID=A0A497VDY9_9RHOB|nr:TetR/AcrR family transcriptional regulator [Litoreibacter meonggei]RLJ41841.1 TetR family transcriptional regulator [Litoreibacter meonggei]